MAYRIGTLVFCLFVSFTLLGQKKEAITRLKGQWDSQGKAFGMPAQISMSWTDTLNNKFTKLEYSMVMTTKENRKQVFAGTAFYKKGDGPKLVATWFDTQGEMHPIKATQTPDSLVAFWGVPGKKYGKTIYAMRSDVEVEVIDFIQHKDSTWREFNRNVLKRK